MHHKLPAYSGRDASIEVPLNEVPSNEVKFHMHLAFEEGRQSRLRLGRPSRPCLDVWYTSELVRVSWHGFVFSARESLLAVAAHDPCVTVLPMRTEDVVLLVP